MGSSMCEFREKAFWAGLIRFWMVGVSYHVGHDPVVRVAYRYWSGFSSCERVVFWKEEKVRVVEGAVAVA